jgi:hypothetical protein
MSAPADAWNTRARQVGRGLRARRIFADLSRGADHQIELVRQAHRAGMLPVISYKVGGNAAGAAAGEFNAVAERAARRLAAFDRPTAVAFWHEPYGNLTPGQYVAASKQLLPIFSRGQLRVGPLLNGWLLDDRRAEFREFCPDELFRLWDWFGIDTYESGTMANPGPHKPGQRVKALRRYLRARGYGRMPIGVGEYNGYRSKTVRKAGKAVLNTDNVWFGCVWNNTGGKGYQLEGARLDAFRHTLAVRRSRARR